MMSSTMQTAHSGGGIGVRPDRDVGRQMDDAEASEVNKG